MVEAGEVSVVKVSTLDNIADAMTKTVPRERLARMVAAMHADWTVVAGRG